MLLGHPTYQNDTDTVLNLPWIHEIYNSSATTKYINVDEWPAERNISIMEKKHLVIGMAKCKGYIYTSRLISTFLYLRQDTGIGSTKGYLGYWY